MVAQKGCKKPNVSLALRGRTRPDLSVALKGCVPWNKGIPASPEVAMRLREMAVARRGKPPWNKGLTAESDGRVAASTIAKVGKLRPDIWKGGRKLASKRYAQAHPEKGRERIQRYRARMRGNHSEAVDLLTIVRRDRWLCGLCGRKVKLENLSFDHIIPVSLGGPHMAANLQVAHRLCNSRRGIGKLPAQLRMVG